MTLDLSTVVDRVKVRLVAAGVTVAARVPTVGATIEIAQVQGLVKARTAVRLLNAVANVLPWLGLGLIALGTLAARRRRRALMAAALGVGVGMIVLGLGLSVAREFYLSAVPPA